MNRFNFIQNMLSEFMKQTDKREESYHILKRYLTLQKEEILLDMKVQLIRLTCMILLGMAFYLIIAIVSWHLLGGTFTLLLTAFVFIGLAIFGLFRRKRLLQLKTERNSTLAQTQDMLENRIKTLTSPADTLLCIFRIIQSTDTLIRRISQQFFS